MALDIDLGTRTVTRVKRIMGVELRIDEETDRPRMSIFFTVGYRDEEGGSWHREDVVERYLTVEQTNFVLGLKSGNLAGTDLSLGAMLRRAVIGIERGDIVLPEPPEPPTDPV